MMRAEVKPVKVEGARLANLYLRHADQSVRLAYLMDLGHDDLSFNNHPFSVTPICAALS